MTLGERMVLRTLLRSNFEGSTILRKLLEGRVSSSPDWAHQTVHAPKTIREKTKIATRPESDQSATPLLPKSVSNPSSGSTAASVTRSGERVGDRKANHGHQAVEDRRSQTHSGEGASEPQSPKKTNRAIWSSLQVLGQLDKWVDDKRTKDGHQADEDRRSQTHNGEKERASQNPNSANRSISSFFRGSRLLAVTSIQPQPPRTARFQAFSGFWGETSQNPQRHERLLSLGEQCPCLL